MTIKDLAAKTGYSVATVSLALNGRGNVSAKSREKILAAASELGYEPNINAKQLKQQSSSNILVVVKGTQNELFGKMVEDIQALIAKTPYQLVVEYEDENANEVLIGARLCREKKPRGMIFLGGNRSNFEQYFCDIDIPCVLVTGSADGLGFENLSSVSTDDFEAARCATEALISLGHTNIALIGGDTDVSDISRIRFEGCMAAFSAHGIKFDKKKSYASERFSYNGGYFATRSLLEKNSGFTAIFAAADVMAIGAIRALGEAGLSVPQDVSVMGIDGLSIGKFLIPRLATVSQAVEKMASRSVEILLQNIENKSTVFHETIPFEINQGESICKK